MSTATKPLTIVGRHAIQVIDRIVRVFSRITPLSDEPDCILRISLDRSKRHIFLSDGVEVHPGEPIIHLHLWNERVLEMLPPYEALGWTRSLIKLFLSSLGMLSEYLNHQSWGDDIVAMRAEFGFLANLEAAQTIMPRYGLDVVLLERPGGRFWRRAFWDNLYSYLLMWAFNPRSLQGKSLTKLVRTELWISRERLTKLYGTRPT